MPLAAVEPWPRWRNAPSTTSGDFGTDQYALGLEYVGHPGPDGFDRVVITGDTDGPVEGRTFRVWWLRGSRVVAGMHVNDWDAIGRVRELVGTRVQEGDLRA